MLRLFEYNLKLAVKNIRRNPILSALMVAAIGIGIGASMSMVTVNYRFSLNPIPQKSDVLHYIRLDNWSADFPFNEGRNPPNQMTYLDATALLRAKHAYRQVAMSRSTLAVEPEGRDERPFFVDVRATTADFFAMFDVPFRYGTGWGADADDAAEQVAVLNTTTTERLFGDDNPVGRTVRLSGQDYRIVGVIEDWEPMPKFYDSSNGPTNSGEDIFIPWSLVVAKELPRAGNTNCWKPLEGSGLQAFLNSECIWIQFWAELRNSAEREEYVNFLNAYVTEQKALGRFPRPLDNRATPVMEYLREQGAVPDEARVLLGLSLLFLVVCLLNTIGLLLAKFLGKATEIGIRRALGASRRVLFQQYLVEAGIIGFTGGILGLGFTWLGLEGIEMQFADEEASRILVMDWNMALLAVALAIIASLVTAIYPTWRACSVQPAAYLSSN
ncbi:MAG TPA: ABC transporter permease [Gammaproteobacteria bacterium]|jgi:putative ABC transport system permease protein